MYPLHKCKFPAPAVLSLALYLLFLPAVVAAPFYVEDAQTPVDTSGGASLLDLPSGPIDERFRHPQEGEKGLISGPMPTRSGLSVGDQTHTLPLRSQDEPVELVGSSATRGNLPIRELLRSYINTRSDNGEVWQQAGQGISRLKFSSSGGPQDVVVPNVVDELSRSIGQILQPRMNDAGVISFSLPGVGDFMLLGGNGLDMTLVLGDLFALSLPGTASGFGFYPNQLGMFSQHIGGAESDSSSESGGSGRQAWSGNHVESATSNLDEDNADKTNKQRMPSLFSLMYELLTYPGTLLVIFAIAALYGLQIPKLIMKLASRRRRRKRSRSLLARRSRFLMHK